MRPSLFLVNESIPKLLLLKIFMSSKLRSELSLTLLLFIRFGFRNCNLNVLALAHNEVFVNT